MDRHILTRYFLGQSPEAEKEEIRQWLESDEANRQVFISERIQFDASLLVDEQALTLKKYFHLSPRVIRYVGIVASVLFLLGGFYAYDTYRNEQLLHAVHIVRIPKPVTGQTLYCRMVRVSAVKCQCDFALSHRILF